MTNYLPYRDQGKTVKGMPIWLDLNHNPQPHEYNILTDYLTGKEKGQYVAMNVLRGKTLSDEQFNKDHDALFRRAIGRWNANYVYMNLVLGNLWRYMDQHQLEHFYDGIQMLRSSPELRPHAHKYFQDLKKDLAVRKVWMDSEAKLMRNVMSSSDDMISMKLSGGSHGGRHRDEITFYNVNYTIGESGKC